ncbi:MAG TPA: hypothetical protein P5186_07960 [Candidatus Paceibacterota bacterium]|nr:hypothetical protein [Verrucomicrobiota bacterium]HRY47964.1 hypothetical protein [Candidatus Paceibacterota bacterium]HSA00662.1 hypothetical protein [Candidatus Paceibacterota bacterium]
MKSTTIIKSLMAAMLLSAATTILNAQSTATTCPLGFTPGYGRSLNAEQRVQHRAAVQQLVSDLRQKKAQGTLTPEEQVRLQQLEQRGGPCITGTPRGRGAGKGAGMGNGYGHGRRQGLRNGTGPRSLNGTCPLNPSTQSGSGQ